MEVRLHPSAGEFREIAEPLYRRDPVGNTIELTLLRSDRFGEDPLLLTMWEGGVCVGAGLQTPPYPLACNALPASAIDSVAAELARIRPDLTGARGSLETTTAFAEAWRAVTGCGWRVRTREHLYRLGTLRPPTGVPGSYREATEDDRPVLVDWVERFFVETFGHDSDEAAGRRFVDNAAVVGDRFMLWEDGGAPVSMAMLRAPAAGVSRIGPVFTPATSRGRGYASALTAAAAAVALADGVDDVVLFADSANPTSNGVYQRIGFDAVADSVRVEFDSSASANPGSVA